MTAIVWTEVRAANGRVYLVNLDARYLGPYREEVWGYGARRQFKSGGFTKGVSTFLREDAIVETIGEVSA